MEAALEMLREAARPVLCLATIDLRREEPALLTLARTLSVSLRWFGADALNLEAPRLTHRSARVHALTGCWGIAESAALAAAGPGSRLVVPRRQWPTVTLALAEAAAPPGPP